MFKPVDFQTIMPRSVDLQRIQQSENSRPVAEQQEFSRELLRRTQLRREQVQKSNAAGEGNRIREDQQEPEDQTGSGQPRSRRFRVKEAASEESPETGEAVDTNRGQHIDIKI